MWFFVQKLQVTLRRSKMQSSGVLDTNSFCSGANLEDTLENVLFLLVCVRLYEHLHHLRSFGTTALTAAKYK